MQTPGTHAAFQVNEDGTTSLATNSVDMPTIFTYDANGRLTWTRQQTGSNGVAMEYNNVNSRFRRMTSGQSQTTYTLDGFGRAIRVTNLVNLKTRVERDACGRVTFSSAPFTAGNGTRGTSRQFDVLGRVTRETDPAGGVTTYLLTGLDVTRTDAANRTTQFGYRAFSGPGSERLTSMRDAADVLTRYGYDVHGNLTSVLGPATA